MKMFQRIFLAVILVSASVALCSSYTISRFHIEKSRNKRSFFESLGASTELGASALAAYQSYKEIAAMTQAKVLLNMNNLSKWPLSNPEIRVLAGETTTVPSRVLPGYTEAIAANQVGATDRFTQGYIAFDAAPGFYCIFYWYIEGSAKFRKQGNSLGVGCRPSNQTIANSSDVLANIDSDTLSNTYMNFGNFTDDSQSSIYFCTEDLCISAIAGSSHQVEVSIDVIPRRVKNLSPTFVGDIAGDKNVTQQQLDSLLDGGECKIDCDDGTTSGDDGTTSGDDGTTSGDAEIDSIFDWVKLYKLSSLKDKTGFVIMMVLLIALPIFMLIIACCCCRCKP